MDHSPFTLVPLTFRQHQADANALLLERIKDAHKKNYLNDSVRTYYSTHHIIGIFREARRFCAVLNVMGKPIIVEINPEQAIQIVGARKDIRRVAG